MQHTYLGETLELLKHSIEVYIIYDEQRTLNLEKFYKTVGSDSWLFPATWWKEEGSDDTESTNRMTGVAIPCCHSAGAGCSLPRRLPLLLSTMCWHSDAGGEVAGNNRLSDRLACVVKLLEVACSLFVW